MGDFPGWWEAASAGWVVGGLMEAFAFFHVYRISLLQYGSEVAPKPRKVWIGTFCILMAVMSNLFSVMFLMDNLVAVPTAKAVLWHSIPDVLFQVQNMLFMLFLLVCFRSNDAVACVRGAWYLATVLNAVAYTTAVLSIMWTFAEMSDRGAKYMLKESFDYPYERHRYFVVNEYILALTNFIALLLHPLGLRGGLSGPEGVDSANAGTAQWQQDAEKGP